MMNDVIKVSSMKYQQLFKQIYPTPNFDYYKGCLGKICVIGGSDLYTGAPYFTAISAIKLGADLSYIVCPKESSNVIKSYSPELMVLPYLNDEKEYSRIISTIDKCHSVVIGPGLGKGIADPILINMVISICITHKKYLILDADALWMIVTNDLLLSTLQNDDKHVDIAPNIILTPNRIEYLRLLKHFDINELESDGILKLSKFVKANVLLKGYHDIFSNGKQIYDLTTDMELCAKRCGGQGDILAGFLSVWLLWSSNLNTTSMDTTHTLNACILATNILKSLATTTFHSKGIGMTATDMINDIPVVIDSLQNINE